LEHQNLGFASLVRTPDDQGFSRQHRFIKRLRANSMAEIFEQETVHVDGSYIYMFAELSKLGATVLSDKLSVILNVMSSGLHYCGPKDVTEEDCCRIITIIALAAGDGTALTANGTSIKPVEGRRELQWIRLPGHMDSLRPIGPSRLPKITMDLALMPQGLELDVTFICTSSVAMLAERRYLSIARLLIDHRAMCPVSIGQANLWLDDQTDDRMYADLRLYYIQAFACSLQCGAQWIVESKRILCEIMPGVNASLDRDLQQKFEEAVEWALSIEIEDDLGEDMREVWGENEVDESWAAQEGEDTTQEHEPFFATEEEKYYNLLLSFVDDIITIGLAVSSKEGQNALDLSFAVQICHDKSSPFLIFAPVNNGCLVWDLCIPNALLDETYRWIARAWVLENCIGQGDDKAYKLIMKTRLFGAPAPAGRNSRVVVR
jgi:hypothetical protein